MRSINVLKVCRGLVLAALGVVAVACTQTVGGDVNAEATAVTTQAATKPAATLFCADCFEETAGGGAGTPNGNGSNGFTGGVAGYASGAAGVALKPSGDKTPCDPGVECVNVFGEPRPLDDSKVRIQIQGAQDRERVYADLPGARGIPVRIYPDDVQCGRAYNENGKCSDPSIWLAKCLAAAMAGEQFWQKFMQEVYPYSKLDYVRLRYAAGKSTQEQISMCYSIYTCHPNRSPLGT